MVNILFVCLGNICRSPMAEGLCRARAAERGLDKALRVDSAGTSGWHISEPPDPRAQLLMRRKGIDIEDLRARAVHADDFERFDHILAMDDDNLRALRAACPKEHLHKIRRVTDFAPEMKVKNVPDPYEDSHDGFVFVFNLLESCVNGLLDKIEAELAA